MDSWTQIVHFNIDIYNELLVLANMESYNAVLIGKGMDQKERMIELRKLARTQLMSIEKLNNTSLKSLEEKSKK